MNRRTLLLVTAGAVLALLNVWRWTGGTTARPANPPSPGSGVLVSADDLALRFATTGATGKTGATSATRDLFQPKLAVVKHPPRIVKTGPPPKTPEQIAEEQARAELAQIKLLGVVFRGDHGEAFLLANGAPVSARIGARVGNHFFVERITPEIVDIRDPETQVSGQLALSGP